METPTPGVCPPNAGARSITAAAALERIRAICSSPTIGADEKYGAILKVLDAMRRTPDAREGLNVNGTHLEPLFCPECGEMARGSLETVAGVAEFELAPDGAVRYTGYTDVWWDEQRTVADEGGNVRLVCPQGHDWAARETQQGRREPS